MENGTPADLDSLKLRHLRFLVVLAEEGHLGRAAARMAMTQPAASRLLVDMEQRFGCALFERGRHGVRALPVATPVLRFAAMLTAEERLVRAQLAESAARPATLRLGTLPTVPTLVIQALQRCKRERPNETVALRQGTLDTLLPPLLAGELDAVIGRFDTALAQPPLAYRRLADEPLAVVAHPAHTLARRRRITAEELRAQPWVAPIRGSSIFRHFVEMFDGLPLPDDLIECASPVALHSLLQDRRRLGLLGVSALSQPWGHDLRRLAVELRSPPGALGLYTVEGRLMPQEVAAFCQTLVRLAGPT